MHNKDDNLTYNQLLGVVQSENINEKRIFIENIEEEFDFYSNLTKKKKEQKREKANKLIPYILKKSNIYTKEELLLYEYKDILTIYRELKKENRNIIFKFFDF